MYRYIHTVLYATVLRVGTYSEDNIDRAGVKVPFLSFQKYASRAGIDYNDFLYLSRHTTILDLIQ